MAEFRPRSARVHFPRTASFKPPTALRISPLTLWALPSVSSLLIAGRLAGNLLHFALGLLSRTFDAILIHGVISNRIPRKQRHGGKVPRPPRLSSRRQEDDQKTLLTHMIAAAAAITAVVIQPTTLKPSWMRKLPMIFGSPVMCIINIMMGTATTPLITALQ